jgi:tRNA-Thr(GGU) m(6)t(6)A37 methyltransferase TsaA
MYLFFCNLQAPPRKLQKKTRTINPRKELKMSANISKQKKSYKLYPIGRVRQHDGEFLLEIEEPFRPALKLMDQFSHVMVFWWAHKLDSPKYRSIMQADLPYAKGTVAGVFACRAEYRPNPIGVTTCPILQVDEAKGIVKLAFIDALDGTPVLDLKPYIPISDRIRDVKVADWLADWPEWMEEADSYFAEHATDFD